MRFWRYIKGKSNEQESSSDMSVENLPNMPADNKHSNGSFSETPENSSSSNQAESNSNELETKSSNSNGDSEKENSKENEGNGSSNSQSVNPKDDSISELDSKSDEKGENRDLEKSSNNDSSSESDNSLSKCPSQDQSGNDSMNSKASQESPNSEDNNLNASREEESLEKTKTNKFPNDANSSVETPNNQSTEQLDQDVDNENDKESSQPSSSSQPFESELSESKKGDEDISGMSDSSSGISNDVPMKNGERSSQDAISNEENGSKKTNQSSNDASSNDQNKNSNIPNEENILDGEKSPQNVQDEQQENHEDRDLPESENTSQDKETSSQDSESTKKDEASKSKSQKGSKESDNSSVNNFEQSSNMESNQPSSSEQNEKKASESIKSQEESNSQESDEENANEQSINDSEKTTPEKADISKHINHPSPKDEFGDHEEDEKEQEKTTPEKTEAQQRKELLQRFKETIEQARNNLIQEEIKEHQLNQEKEELGENANQFLGRLDGLPPFDQRDKEYGYSIDTESTTDVDEIIIKNLINKFLNQRFCSHKEDLNVRSNSLEKSRGFLKWEVKDVIVHLETEQLTKVLNDKYGYNYSQGKNEFVPLSFYFDLSGSMSSFTNMLATIAIELLKKDVKVLIGNNERVEVQIDSLDKGISVEELADFLDDLGINNRKIKYKKISQNIDNYLINHKAEKVCVFADFDPLKSVCNLSHYAKVYWFCFEKAYKMEHITNFDGFIYPVKDLNTIADGLKKVNAQRFKALVYTENPKQLRKVLK